MESAKIAMVMALALTSPDVPKEREPAPVVRETCRCSPECTCGCQEGGTCKCRVVEGGDVQWTGSPYLTQPVVITTQQAPLLMSSFPPVRTVTPYRGSLSPVGFRRYGGARVVSRAGGS